MKLLIVDDEVAIVRSMSTYLKMKGFLDIQTLTDSRQVLDYVNENQPDVVLLDLTMPHVSGLTCLEDIKRDCPNTIVIILTADDQISIAVKCTQLGAHDYFVKPIDQNRLVHVINKALEAKKLNEELVLIQQSLQNPDQPLDPAFKNIITCSNKMKRIFEYIQAISISRRPVLILGETGTGKELIANSIHKTQAAKDELISVNVAGLDDNTLSDTLFGHKKGAFTSAIANREGLIKKAGRGTLFLDEIGDLDAQSQVKLLRLFQENSYYPLGSDSLEQCHARFITATHQDLENLIAEGDFRRDLYYRLMTHTIKIPPLRERRKDIPLLTHHFIEKVSSELNREPPNIPKKLYNLFDSYSFPGNVRELEMMLYDAVIQTNGETLNIDSIRSLIESSSTSSNNTGWKNELFLDELPTLKHATQDLIDEALKRTNNNQSKASKILGITRQALSKRLKNNKEVEISVKREP